MFLYYCGRALQLAGMWILLADIFMAGPLGPDPSWFVYGILVFVAGWLLVRWKRPSAGS